LAGAEAEEVADAAAGAELAGAAVVAGAVPADGAAGACCAGAAGSASARVSAPLPMINASTRTTDRMMVPIPWSDWKGSGEAAASE